LLDALAGKLHNDGLQKSGQWLVQWAAQHDGPLKAAADKLLFLHSLPLNDSALRGELFQNDPADWLFQLFGLTQSDFAFANVLSAQVIGQIMTEHNVVIICQTLPYKAGSEASLSSFTDEALRRFAELKPDDCLLIQYNLFNVFFIWWHFWRISKTRSSGARTTSIAGQAHKYPNRIALSVLILLFALKMRPPNLPTVRVNGMSTLFRKLPVPVLNLAEARCDLSLSGHIYSLVACLNGVKANGDRAIEYFARVFGVDIISDTHRARWLRALFRERLDELIVWINCKYSV